MTAQLDTAWAYAARNEPYNVQNLKLLRLVLTEQELNFELEDTPRGQNEDGELVTPREKGPPWHKVTIIYEPMRLDSTAPPCSVSPAAMAATGPPGQGPGGANSVCLLQSLNHWNPDREAAVGGPEHVNFGTSGDSGSLCMRSLQLPSGEHWYLVQDDALKAGSVLSVQADGAMLRQSKSAIDFVDPG